MSAKASPLTALPVELLRIVCRVAIESPPAFVADKRARRTQKRSAHRLRLIVAANVARTCRALRDASWSVDECRRRNDEMLTAAIDRASKRAARCVMRQTQSMAPTSTSPLYASVRLPSTVIYVDAAFIVIERRVASSLRPCVLLGGVGGEIEIVMRFWNAALAQGYDAAHAVCDRLWRNVQAVLCLSPWSDATERYAVDASATATTSMRSLYCGSVQTGILHDKRRAPWCDNVRQVVVCCAADRFEINLCVDFADGQSRADALALLFRAYMRAALDAHAIPIVRRVDYADNTAASLP